MSALYEQDRLLHQYLLFHYGTPEEILAGSDLPPLPNAVFQFPVATVGMLRSHFAAPGRVLDLGCAVGRSSFEFSRFTEGSVTGIDFSRRFIEAAEALRRGEKLICRRYAEGHWGEDLPIHAGIEGVRPDRIQFECGDAMDLRDDLGSFDVVHAANLLCRLPCPERFLQRLGVLVVRGGWLVMATPGTWLEEFTAASEQPPGPTLDYLQSRLGADFTLQEVRELPFCICEHRRKFQLSTSQTSVWQRKG